MHLSLHLTARCCTPLLDRRLQVSCSLSSGRQGPGADVGALKARAFSLTAWGRSLRLNALRRKADETPGDLGAESALLAELAELGQHKELVERWESKAGLFDEAVDRANPYLRDDEGFRLYLRSLASLASSSSNAAPLFSKLAAAPTQRAAALEGTPVASAPVSEAASVPPAADQVPEPQPARPQLSTSALVSALFSGPGSRGKGGDVKFVGGASGAAAGAQEPIRIIVEEGAHVSHRLSTLSADTNVQPRRHSGRRSFAQSSSLASTRSSSSPSCLSSSTRQASCAPPRRRARSAPSRHLTPRTLKVAALASRTCMAATKRKRSL